MKFRLSVLLFVLSALVLFPINSFACACCAENNFYSIWTGKPDGYYLEVLEKVNFAQEAELYLDAAGFETIKGLEELSKNSEENDLSKFILNDSFAAKTWKLNFQASN